MPSEKAHAEIPMIMYEPRHESYTQEPSAPEYCSQAGKQASLGGLWKEHPLRGCVANIDSVAEPALKGPA